MSEQRRPAWAKDSVVLRLGAPVSLEDLSPEWAFGGATGAGVRIAVVDSGIDADHPLLEGCVDGEGAVDFGVADDGSVMVTQGPHGDVFGHGTACAGIIHSLAPEARLTSVRVLGPGLSGKAAAFHAGLAWAVDQGFDVINLSLGTGKKEWALAFHEVCDRAYFGNTFVVTAANNVARASYPSLFASVASVACNTTTDPRRFHANPEPPTEFLARGIDVEVAWLDGGTTRTTGNSFAAPHIAGLAALVRSKHPELRPYQIKTALWATSANVREASEIDVAGRRGTVMAPRHRSTSYRRTSVPGPVVPPAAASAPAVPGTAVPSAPDALDALAEAVAFVALADGPRDDVSGHAVRLGHRRDDGTPVWVRDLSGLTPDTLAAVTARVRQASGIHHPHLEPLTVVESGSVAAVVTPARGRPVDDLLADDPLRPPAWRVAVVLAASAAVAALHAGGVTHGDLDPADLLVDERGRLRVAGVVRRCVAPDSSRFPGGRAMSVESLRYLAREQLDGGVATPATDVHALALIACRVLTGRLPYADVDRVGDLLRQRMGQEPIAVRLLDPDIEGAVAEVLDRALDPSPSARHRDAGELTAALTGAIRRVLGDDALAAAGPLDDGVLDGGVLAALPGSGPDVASTGGEADEQAAGRWWRRRT